MSRASLLAFAVVTPLLFSTSSQAARITDVADAVDTVMINGRETEKPIDIYVGAEVTFEFSRGVITREPIDRVNFINPDCNQDTNRECLPVDELKWKRGRHRMNINGQIGMFRDLAFTFDLPIYFSNKMQFAYASGVDATNSSVDNASGTLFPNDFASKRSGVGNLELGVLWAPLNDERDPSKPSWTLFFKWAMPYTASTYDPSVAPATEANPGKMGDGVHWLTFGTAISKRIAQLGLIGIDPNANRRGFMDPYMLFDIKIPIPDSNKAPQALVEGTNNPFGRPPSKILGMTAGFEYVPFEDLRQHRQFAIDFGMRTTIVTEGRNYSELTDPLGELTLTEQYVTIGGHLNAYFRATEFLRFKLGGSATFMSEHFLTFENVGNDNDNNGQVLDEPGSPDEPNNFYDDRYDQVGHRFKTERNTIFTFMVGVEGTI